MSRLSASDRFWAKVKKTPTCWLWTGGVLSHKGYGMLMISYPPFRKGYAHRFSYEQAFGPIPTGTVIYHTCQVPGCVNPAHLEAVTYRERRLRDWNTRRAA